MKKLILFLALWQFKLATHAQWKFLLLDKSPMDMSYYPPNYPILKIEDKVNEPLIARMIYGRPQKDGRIIFGDLEPYGKIWRMGANEATEIEFFKDVKISKLKLKKGRYTMYALLDPYKWTLILNKETDIWGAFKYDSTKDILRTEVPVQKLADKIEIFSIAFEKTSNSSANLVMAWDDVLVKMPFSW